MSTTELALKNSHPIKKRFIYHGSSEEFDVPKPMPNCRQSKEGAIVWGGEAIFATYDRRIALHYTVNKKVVGYASGVSLLDEIGPNDVMKFIILGGKDKEDAMDKLYGTGSLDDSTGYLYIMNGAHFKWEHGLGIMERVARPKIGASDFYIRRDIINRRIEIEEYVKQGKIILLWSPLDELIIEKPMETKPVLFQYNPSDSKTLSEDLSKEILLGEVRTHLPCLDERAHRIVVSYV